MTYMPKALETLATLRLQICSIMALTRSQSNWTSITFLFTT